MKRAAALFVLFLPLAFLACDEDCDPVVVAPRLELHCFPCDGTGDEMLLNTSSPVPIADIVNHDLCFAQDGSERCWYECPGSIEDTVWHGDEICCEPQDGG